jgi:hypothetical protein
MGKDCVELCRRPKGVRVCSDSRRIADNYSETRLRIGSQLQGTQLDLSEGNISQHTVRAHRNPDRHNKQQQRKTVVGVTMSYQD